MKDINNYPRLIFSYLRSHIVGQDLALRQIANGIERGEGKLSAGGRPKGSFLLLGPTGVGKTESAKQTAAYLYGPAKEGFGVVDMAEYASQDAVEGWKKQVTESLRQRPQGGVLLLDEIEKAHREVTRNLLQMLDEARLGYGGVTHDLSPWYVFCTSNLGCAELMNLKHSAYATVARTARAAAEQHLLPENVARFDAVCVFQLLGFGPQQDVCRALLDAYLRLVQEAAGVGALLFALGMAPYAVRPTSVFQEHCFNGLNDVAFGLLVPWARHALRGRRARPSVTLACGLLPATLILADGMVMRYCQLDSPLVWFAFLGFVGLPPRWLLNPPGGLGWLGKRSLTLYGLSFLPFLLKWYPTGFPAF